MDINPPVEYNKTLVQVVYDCTTEFVSSLYDGLLLVNLSKMMSLIAKVSYRRVCSYPTIGYEARLKIHA